MKGLIIGAGIGGLSTAIGLEKQGISVEIFEAANEIKPIGAGILVPPNAMAVLNEYGIANEVERCGCHLNSLKLVSFKGSPISETLTSYAYQSGEFRTVAIHRGTLQKLLISALNQTVIKTRHQCETVDNTTDGVEAHFLDAPIHKGDFLVGADGIHSKVRKSIFPEASLRYSGQICWRGIAKIDLPAQWHHQLTEIWGNGTRFGFVRISADEVYWYATKHQKQIQEASEPTNMDELLTLFRDYIEPVRDILENTHQSNLIENSISDLAALPTWFNDSTVLVGDAAHASTPNLGQGGAQAIEDSYALANAVSENNDLSIAFEGFVGSRSKKVNSVVKQSWQVGQVTNWSNSWLCAVRNMTLRSFAPVFGSHQAKMLYSWP